MELDYNIILELPWPIEILHKLLIVVLLHVDMHVVTNLMMKSVSFSLYLAIRLVLI